MLPLPRFSHHTPTTIEAAIALLSELGSEARLIAGGTDLLVNMKHGLVAPSHLISLASVRELVGIHASATNLRIGAMTPLEQVAQSALVKRHGYALCQAAAAVGGPHHRRMGTLGGNVCLDTRCLYYNQTHFWRQALGYCLKKDGTACHVVSSGKNCVAAASNDTGPTLMVLEATFELASPTGVRRVRADAFYTNDGIANTVLQPSELLTMIEIPIVEGRRSGFEKLRRRGAIDFPLLNAAARLDWQGEQLTGADLVLSALAARPKRIKAAARLARGDVAGDALWDELAEAAFKQCKPLSNIDNDPQWRRAMAKVLVKKALLQASRRPGSAQTTL